MFCSLLCFSTERCFPCPWFSMYNNNSSVFVWKIYKKYDVIKFKTRTRNSSIIFLYTEGFCCCFFAHYIILSLCLFLLLLVIHDFFPFLYLIFCSFFKLLIEIEEIFSGQTTEYWKIYETWCILERFEPRLIWFTDNWLGFFWERVSISGCAEWICFFRIGTGSRSWKVVWLYLLKIGFDSDMLFRGRFWDSVNWGFDEEVGGLWSRFLGKWRWTCNGNCRLKAFLHFKIHFWYL